MTRARLSSMMCSAVAAMVCVASAAPHPAEAADKIPRLAFVSPYSPATIIHGTNAFWEKLRELGWTRSENLFVEERVGIHPGKPQLFCAVF